MGYISLHGEGSALVRQRAIDALVDAETFVNSAMMIGALLVSQADDVSQDGVRITTLDIPSMARTVAPIAFVRGENERSMKVDSVSASIPNKDQLIVKLNDGNHANVVMLANLFGMTDRRVIGIGVGIYPHLYNTALTDNIIEVVQGLEGDIDEGRDIKGAVRRILGLEYLDQLD